jgi:hypothetical protein
LGRQWARHPLGIIAGGGGPRELLHMVYGVLDLGIVPVLARISASWTPRRRGVTTFVAALVTVVVLLRLAATG